MPEPVQDMIDGVCARILSGDIRAIARAISWMDNDAGEGRELLRTLAAEPAARRGCAHIIGMTGPPGAGKSTLADKLIGVFRSRGLRVAVLAVDPSSPFTGGAILGDRLRMQSHATDPGVFIRSLATRGALGGLSRATGSSCRILEAAGYEVIIVETVGVGQSEVDIVKVADTVVLVSVPGLGDDIQVIKAGIMEIGDVFVVNKADRDGADRVYREIRTMLETAATIRRGKAPEGGPDTLSTHIVKAGHHGVNLVSPASRSGGTGRADGADEGQEVPASAEGAGVSGLTVPLPGPVSAASPGDQKSLPVSGELSLPPVLKTNAETGEGIESLVDACIRRRAELEASGELILRRKEAARAELRSALVRRMFSSIDTGDGAVTEDVLLGEILERKIDVLTAADRLFSVTVRGGTE